MDEDNESGRFKKYSSLLEASTIGLTMVFSTFIGLGIGLFFDKIFKLKPLLTIVFLIFGITAGFINIYKIIKSKRL